MNNEIIQTNTGLVIPEGIGEEQFFDYGSKLAKADKTLQWYIGDWYNAIPWGDKKAACEKVGLNYKTASIYGDICKRYQIPIRIGNCTFKHHQVIAALPEPRRLPLLQEAVEKHWSTTVLRKQAFPEQQSPAPKATPTPAPKQEREPEQEEDDMPFDTGLILVLTGISKSTSSSCLTAARREIVARFGEDKLDTKDKYLAAAKQLAAEKKCKARFKEADKIQEEIEKLSKQSQLQINKAVSAKTAMLEADFDRRVRESADAMIPDRVRIYEELQAKADIAQMRYLAMASGISAHIDQQEYRILRSFFHSDKTPTDQQKNEAFHIIQKIGEYVKATAQ